MIVFLLIISNIGAEFFSIPGLPTTTTQPDLKPDETRTRYFMFVQPYAEKDESWSALEGSIKICKGDECDNREFMDPFYVKEVSFEVIEALIAGRDAQGNLPPHRISFDANNNPIISLDSTETLRQDWWQGTSNILTIVNSRLSYICANCDVGDEFQDRIWIAANTNEEFIKKRTNEQEKATLIRDLAAQITAKQNEIDKENDPIIKANLEAEKKALEDEKKDAEDGWSRKIQVRGKTIVLDPKSGKTLDNTDHIYDKDGKKIADITNSYYTVEKLADGTIQVKISEGGKSVYYYTDGTTLELIRDKDGNLLDKDFDLSEWINKASTPEEKERREKFRKAEIDKVMAGPFAISTKLSTMGFWRALGTYVHAFNAYKGIASLTGLIWDWMSDEEVAKRKKALQDKFCVIGSTSECLTSIMCNEYFPSKPKNYMLVTNWNKEIPLIPASIVGERSDEINFKGETRENLIEWLGNRIFLDGEFINLTDPSIDTRSLPITVWLYNVQLSVKNQLDKDIYLNVEFRGPQRNAKWYSEWRVVEKGETRSKKILRYSTTEYDKVCFIFKEGISKYEPGGKYSYLFAILNDKKFPVYEFCSPLAGAGDPSTLKYDSKDFNEITTTEGENI
jgi:hypothetical protein